MLWKTCVLVCVLVTTCVEFVFGETILNTTLDVKTGAVDICKRIDTLSTEEDEEDVDVRLPKHLVPLNYKLELIPFLSPAQNFTLEGKAWIDFKCVEATNKITLHAKAIAINESTIKLTKVNDPEHSVSIIDARNDQGNFSLGPFAYDEPREFFNVTVSQGLEVGQVYRIYMEYTGKLGDDLIGFYRSSYFHAEKNETRYLGVTQFQPPHARRAFPCFDEPALKATYEVSLGRMAEMSSISNMNLRSTEPIPEMNGWYWDRYYKSVPMSTYLVAFVVSDFEYRVSQNDSMKTEFRVWARPGAVEQAEYARDIGPRILKYFEDYFGIEFPLPKMDMIAVPDMDGAMENWGLVTYSESDMLYDPSMTSDRDKVSSTTTIAHELAHQWFGNLVTNKWWSDLWLNEGFASYVMYLGVNHIAPEWKILEHFVSDEMHDVFQPDALSTSHPISVDVNHPDEIDEIFDEISYEKGASIIRMMNHFLTESTFKKGLHNYLKKWTYQAAVQNDLWDALTEQAHTDGTLDKSITVHEIMDTWTLQKGYPIIDVVRHYNGSVTFSQAKFQTFPDSTGEKPSSCYRWFVPISVATLHKNSDFAMTTPTLWLSNKTVSETQKLDVDPSSWMVVNVQQTGFYRVNYDHKNWKLIINQLNSNHSAIHTVNRAQILDDAFNLARVGKLPYNYAFGLTPYLHKDEDPLAWKTFLIAFEYIGQMLTNTTAQDKFNNFVQKLLKDQVEKVGFEEKATDSLLRKLHRARIIHWVCNVNDEDCLYYAGKQFSKWMSTAEPDIQNEIPTNLRRSIYCAAIKQGTEKEWNFLWQRYLKSNVASDQETILIALGCSTDPKILYRYLAWSTTEGSGIRKHNSNTVIWAVSSQPVGSLVAFNFIRKNLLNIKEYLGGDASQINDEISYAVANFNTQEQLNELESLVKRHRIDLGTATGIMDQAVESVRANLKWMDDNYDFINDWLDNPISQSA